MFCKLLTYSYVGEVSGAYCNMVLLPEAVSSVRRHVACCRSVGCLQEHWTSLLETDWSGGGRRRFW